MESFDYLLALAIILLSTKVLGLVTKKIQMPSVVGALIAGLIIGPACLGIVSETSFIEQVSEVGVIILMFSAGLETDIKELKKSGKASFVIALIGVIVPLIGGFGVAWFFNRPELIASDAPSSTFLQNMFIGVILTATSVSITVETLKEMGKLSTRAGNAILGAAIIDDILGIIALTVITSLSDPTVDIVIVLLKIVGFFAFSIIIGVVFHIVYKKWTANATHDKRRFVIIAFVFCLLNAYCAEKFFGVADITGAYIAGVMLSSTSKTTYISSRFETLSYMLLSPIFFASIGLKVVLPNMTASIIIFAVVLTIVAILTKILGCGLGAKLCGMNNRESLQVGSGMVSRGEVALIVASKGAAVGLMSSALMAPIVIVVVITTIIAPVLLKITFRNKKDSPSAADSLEPSALVDSYNKRVEITESSDFDDSNKSDDL